MNKRINFSGLLRIFTLAVGMLAVSSPVFEQIIQERINEESAANNKNEESESQDEFLIPAFQATISSYHLDLDNFPKIQPAIPVSTRIITYVNQVYILTSYSFFKTLFRNIISPNAP